MNSDLNKNKNKDKDRTIHFVKKKLSEEITAKTGMKKNL